MATNKNAEDLKKDAKQIEDEKEQKRTALAKERMILALEKSLGIVSNACAMAKIGRTAFYRWLKEDQEFAAKVEDINEIALDFVESSLFKLIKGAVVPDDKIFVNAKGKKTIVKNNRVYPPDTQATTFYLATKGKQRGYIKSQEIELPEGITKINFTRRTINSRADVPKLNSDSLE